MSEWFKEHDWKSCVGLKLTGGSNPLLCAKQKNTSQGVFFCFVVPSFEEDSRVGAVLREQNALPYGPSISQAHWQRRQLIIAERGAPLKARILFSAPRKRLRNIRSIVCNKQKAPLSGAFFRFPFMRSPLPFLRIACQLRP